MGLRVVNFTGGWLERAIAHRVELQGFLWVLISVFCAIFKPPPDTHSGEAEVEGHLDISQKFQSFLRSWIRDVFLFCPSNLLQITASQKRTVSCLWWRGRKLSSALATLSEARHGRMQHQEAEAGGSWVEPSVGYLQRPCLKTNYPPKKRDPYHVKTWRHFSHARSPQCAQVVIRGRKASWYLVFWDLSSVWQRIPGLLSWADLKQVD